MDTIVISKKNLIITLYDMYIYVLSLLMNCNELKISNLEGRKICLEHEHLSNLGGCGLL
jgi:hypothetical protein